MWCVGSEIEIWFCLGETETAVLDIYYVYNKVVLNNPAANKRYCGIVLEN